MPRCGESSACVARIAQALGEFFGGHGPGKDIALYHVAVGVLEKVHLLQGFHAFGHGSHLQLTGHVHDVLDHDLVAAVGFERAEEDAVQFEHVHGQILENVE